MIRPAGPADEPFLREMLYEALFVPPGSPPFPRAVLDDPPIAHYVDGFGRARDIGVIAEADGRPLGAAWVRWFDEADPGYGFVDAATPELTIAVVADRRGTGIGTALVDALLSRVPRCSLSTDERNPSTRLYARHDFTVVARDGHTLTMLHDV